MLIWAVIGLVFYVTIKFVHRVICGKQNQRKSDFYSEGWFGKEPKPLNNDDDKELADHIRPFKIAVPDEVLTDLQRRLENTRFHEPLVDALDFTYGFNPHYLRELVEYWKTQYRWRKHEEELNKYPHFKTKLEGLNVHFMRVKPTVPDGRQVKVIPLLIIHGWPGSFVEFYKIIPLLTTPRAGQDYVFEVICPSIPGFGFSEIPHRTGFNSRAASRIFITLMQRIGHQKFYVQGGDWGSVIATNMSRYYPERVFGLHINMFGFRLRTWDAFKCAFISWFPFLISSAEYKLLYPLKKKAAMILEESAYFHMNATKPDTIGCALADSPAGLAAYILEKFSVITNTDYVKLPDGGLTEKFTMDELLTNIMVYWLNNNFTSASRFYKENMNRANKQKHEKVPVTVPSAVAAFPHEVLMYPKTLLSQQLKNLVSYTMMPRGGHFAAMEEPQLLADDIWKFVTLVEKNK